MRPISAHAATGSHDRGDVGRRGGWGDVGRRGGWVCESNRQVLVLSPRVVPHPAPCSPWSGRTLYWSRLLTA